MLKSKSLTSRGAYLIALLLGGIYVFFAAFQQDYYGETSVPLLGLVVLYTAVVTIGWHFAQQEITPFRTQLYFTIATTIYLIYYWQDAVYYDTTDYPFLSLPLVLQIFTLRRWSRMAYLSIITLWLVYCGLAYNDSYYDLELTREEIIVDVIYVIILLLIFDVLGFLLVRQEKTHQRVQQISEQESKRYESLAQMKNQFIGTATHDLKNPLATIIGYAHLLRDRPPPALDEVSLYADSILRSSNKMQTLINDMLDIAQIETGVDLELQPLPLDSFLGERLKDFEMLAQKKNITLEYKPPPVNLPVPIDPQYMIRAIDNLMSNAIKYTPEGGRVTLRGLIDAPYAIIEVADTGLGIPKQAMPRLFEPFYRVPELAHIKQEGTGLGLSVVKAVVDQHRGTIQVHSTPGEGSTFRITLPLTTPPAPNGN